MLPHRQGSATGDHRPRAQVVSDLRPCWVPSRWTLRLRHPLRGIDCLVVDLPGIVRMRQRDVFERVGWIKKMGGVGGGKDLRREAPKDE